jgi:hypothetical protein
MARSITDVAVALGVMTGLDPADPAVFPLRLMISARR